MTWVVDASVAVKWFVEEVRSAGARAVLASGEPVIAPDLIVPETCNTAWKKVGRGDISREQAEAIVRILPLSFDRLAPTASLSSRALELALRFDHPAYDCFYLALAESENSVLVTDDLRVIELGKKAGLGKLVKGLGSFERRSR
ncbi:MAG: type II toxin-antitoxin system VapC family toxin [Betaproteobacteria bacterium]|nr:type II toxin-antitoxin system VapC family toxin [Betaproteobacteria bacterium]